MYYDLLNSLQQNSRETYGTADGTTHYEVSPKYGRSRGFIRKASNSVEA